MPKLHSAMDRKQKSPKPVKLQFPGIPPTAAALVFKEPSILITSINHSQQIFSDHYQVTYTRDSFGLIAPKTHITFSAKGIEIELY